MIQPAADNSQMLNGTAAAAGNYEQMILRDPYAHEGMQADAHELGGGLA